MPRVLVKMTPPKFLLKNVEPVKEDEPNQEGKQEVLKEHIGRCKSLDAESDMKKAGSTLTM